MDFKTAYLKAIDAAEQSGEIRGLRAKRLREAAKSPKRLARIQDRAELQAHGDKVKLRYGAAGAFDWTNLLAIIQQLLPVILQLIALIK